MKDKCVRYFREQSGDWPGIAGMPTDLRPYSGRYEKHYIELSPVLYEPWPKIKYRTFFQVSFGETANGPILTPIADRVCRRHHESDNNFSIGCILLIHMPELRQQSRVSRNSRNHQCGLKQ